MTLFKEKNMFLLIKVTNYNDKLDFLDKIKGTASKNNVPVILFTSPKSFTEIICMFTLEYNNYYFNLYTNTHKIFTNFSYLSLKGKGLNAIIKYFEEITNDPIAVYDIDFKCIAATNSNLNFPLKINNTSERIDLDNLYYFHQKIKNESIFPDKDEISQIIFPITFGFKNEVKGYISVFEANYILKKSDFFVLEIAASATLIEMKKRLEMRTIEERFINDLVYDLIYNKFDDQSILFERAKLIGLNKDTMYIVIVFEILNSPNYKVENTLDETNQDKIFNEISKKIQYRNHYSITGKLSSSVISLWPVFNDTYDDSLNIIKSVCESIRIELERNFENQNVLIGIGNITDNLQSVHKSYKEAKDAVLLGRILYGKDAIIEFKDLGILKLLSKFEDKNSLIELIPKELIILQEHDTLYNTNLIDTLKVYLECNGNASKAASKLFIHYKTILYRLEKINEICKINLENSNQRLEIEIGLKLLYIINKS